MADAKTTVEDIFAEGEEFMVGGRKYVVLPILLKEVRKFREDNLIGYNPMYLADDEEKSARVNFWMEKYVRDEKGEPVTLQRAMDENWRTKHLEDMLMKLARVSG